MYSTILHSWSAQDLRSLELISSGPVAFFTFIWDMKAVERELEVRMGQ